MTQNPRTQSLSDAGVSIWLDDLSRQRMSSGNLRELIETRNVVGVTTNPSIFQSAISGRSEYDADIARLSGEGKDVEGVVEVLTTDDVRQAADMFSEVHTATHGVDGRVSIEVDPRLAHDTDKTVEQAKRLREIVDRENVFVKIPATEAGLPAITATIGEGISVNVTLIFSVERYQDVIEAYLDGLDLAAAAGRDLSKIHSVASFFVSRVDAEIDKRLGELGGEAETLRGSAGVANARAAFGDYLSAFGGERFLALKDQGANVQRPLWASTGVKNPEYPDTLYVDYLVASPSVSTMPENTLEAVAEHSELQPALDADSAEDGEGVLARIADAGVDLADVFALLEREGVEKFEKSWEELLATVSASIDDVRA